MKIDKYVLFMPAANVKACKRLNVRPLSAHNIALLYAIKQKPINYSAIMEYFISIAFDISDTTIHYSLQYLLSIQFIERTGKAYTIAPLGREYLSLIRRYLLNKRL